MASHLDLQRIPDALRHQPKWVLWRLETREDPDKPDKVPVDPRTGHFASPTNPATWASFDEALLVYQRGGFDGLGLVVSSDDDFVGVDLDKCRDPDTGEVAEWAESIVQALDSYAEVSPSGTGLHVWVRGALPPGSRRKGQVEIYDCKRYFTVTGDHLEGSPTTVEERQAELDQIWREHVGTAGSHGVGDVPPMPDLTGVDPTEVWGKSRLALSQENLSLLEEPERRLPDFDNDHSKLDFAAVCALVRADLTDAEIVVLWRDAPLGQRQKVQSRDDYLMRTIAAAREGVAEDDKQDSKPNQARQLLRLAGHIALFRTPEGDAYAALTINNHREVWPVRSSGFRRWLVRTFYQHNGKPPNSEGIRGTLDVFEARAVFDSPTHPVAVRLAEHENKVYLDLANEEWEAIEIGSNGWRVVSEPPVFFRRAKGMLPLPHPAAGGDLAELRNFLNLPEDERWILLVGWLVGTLRGRGPYPLLALYGQHGSTKSTAERLLRALVDPNASPLRSTPREVRDLMITANNSYILAFDNLSWLPDWLSDALCRLATGGGFATRELYTDADETIFDAQRPTMFNGIEEVITRGDLIDRSIIIELPTVPDEKRRPEAELYAAFEEARPRILGALLDAVSTALRNLPNIKLERHPRMADFAEWVTAAEASLGLEPGGFLAAYDLNRANARLTVLDSEPLVAPLVEFMCGQAMPGVAPQRGGPPGEWVGTAGELLEALRLQVDESVRRQKGWPRTPSWLSNKLRRVAPDLPALGLAVEFPRDSDRNRTRRIKLQLLNEEGEEASEASKSSDGGRGPRHEGQGTVSSFGRPVGRSTPPSEGTSERASDNEPRSDGRTDGPDVLDAPLQSSVEDDNEGAE